MSITKLETGAESVPAPLTPMEMLDRAVSNGASIETLEKLMGLQERWETNNARKAFDAAMSAAKADIPIIVKNRAVDFTTAKGRTNYVYEDMAAIAAAVDPILAKNGLSYRFRTSQDAGGVTVTCVISHRDGHSEENSLSAARDDSGNKNSIQGIGSTVTYLQRYTLKAALGLSVSKDNDANDQKAEDYDTAQWTDRMLEAGLDRDALILIGNEIKAAKDIPSGALKVLRAAWAGAMTRANDAAATAINEKAVGNA